MVQVSLVGYASAGAFLGLAYFDFYYDLIAVVVLCRTVVASQKGSVEPQQAGSTAAYPALNSQRVRTERPR